LSPQQAHTAQVPGDLQHPHLPAFAQQSDFTVLQHAPSLTALASVEQQQAFWTDAAPEAQQASLFAATTLGPGAVWASGFAVDEVPQPIAKRNATVVPRRASAFMQSSYGMSQGGKALFMPVEGGRKT
jgi:hypothetical protein